MKHQSGRSRSRCSWPPTLQLVHLAVCFDFMASKICSTLLAPQPTPANAFSVLKTCTAHRAQHRFASANQHIPEHPIGTGVARRWQTTRRRRDA